GLRHVFLLPREAQTSPRPPRRQGFEAQTQHLVVTELATSVLGKVIHREPVGASKILLQLGLELLASATDDHAVRSHKRKPPLTISITKKMVSGYRGNR